MKIGRTGRWPADAEDCFEVRKPFAEPCELGCTFPVGDDRFGTGVAQPMLQRLLPKKREERYRDGAHFENSDVSVRRLGRLREQNTDAIATLGAIGLQQIGRSI